MTAKWVLHVLFDDLGFGMADLARATGYPHATLRAFRSGALKQDEITYEDVRLKLHDLAIMTAGLGRHRGKSEGGTAEASLLNTTLVDGYTATGWDLYEYLDGMRCNRAHRGLSATSAGRGAWRQMVEPRHSGLCELAEGAPAEEVLDRRIPDWRTRFWTDCKVVVDSDGDLSIVKKAEGDL